MKIGDTVPVTIAGQTVANASVKELADGTATLVVPATLVVMATRTELTVETPRESSTETVITGVDQEGVERTESAVAQEANNQNTTVEEVNNSQSEPNSNVSTQTETSESATTENSSNETPAVQDTSTSVETNSTDGQSEVKE